MVRHILLLHFEEYRHKNHMGRRPYFIEETDLLGLIIDPPTTPV